MKIILIVICLSMSSCVVMSARQFGTFRMPNRHSEDRFSQAISKITIDLGFTPLNCKKITYPKGDVSANALAKGSFTTKNSVDTVNIRCFQRVKNEKNRIYSNIFLVIKKNKDEQVSYSTEFWATPPGHEGELINVTSRFWNRLGLEKVSIMSIRHF